MKSTPRWLLASAIAPLIVLGSGAALASGNATSDDLADRAALAQVVDVPTRDLCGAVQPGEMRCLSKIVTRDTGIEPYPHGGGGMGLVPTDLLSAYAIPASSASGGKIVALVDATDSADAFSDVTAYRAMYGLPTLPQCTSAPTNGGAACFYKVNQTGEASSYPQPDPQNGWQVEIALDIEMVSAVCPDCSILLVEATSATTANLGTAVNTAARMGAVAISNSYGGGEDNSVESADTEYYDHAGILVTAAAGDDAYSAGASFPASSEFVLGVGGTTLSRSTSSRGWAEAAWSSGGSGCSRVIHTPSFQAGVTRSDCAMRSVSDVSAVGDPSTGLEIYSEAEGGWQVVGGTSAASPIVAGIFTRLGLAGATNAFPYTHTSAFYDVTSGSNGSCGGTEICTARTGYDGPTGIGTPNGAVLAGSGTPPPPPSSPDAGGTSSGSPDSGTTSTSGDAGGGTVGGRDSGSTGSGDSDSGGGYGTVSGSDDGGTSNGNGDNGSGDLDSPSSGQTGGCTVGHGARSGGGLVFALIALAGIASRRRRKGAA